MRAQVLTLALSIVCSASPALAQSFSELERSATEVPEDVATWAAPLLTDCRNGSAAAKRQCVQARRRDAAALLRGTYVVDLPGRTRASVAPYEAHNGGFRIRMPGLAFTRQGAPGV